MGEMSLIRLLRRSRLSMPSSPEAGQPDEQSPQLFLNFQQLVGGELLAVGGRNGPELRTQAAVEGRVRVVFGNDIRRTGQEERLAGQQQLVVRRDPAAVNVVFQPDNIPVVCEVVEVDSRW